MESHYEVLGLSPAADERAVRRAYRTLLKEHHPDQGGSAVRRQRRVRRPLRPSLIRNSKTNTDPILILDNGNRRRETTAPRAADGCHDRPVDRRLRARHRDLRARLADISGPHARAD
ncbi:J domain-containing protein [Natronorubrum tibetense]|uniref:J domain-containing protein n=1 Tax=Natronorubrum tibetense TaxID=63128 RepID=UPI001F4C62FA|nr:J domain-containing protein [Natronorubrum tibetense]